MPELWRGVAGLACLRTVCVLSLSQSCSLRARVLACWRCRKTML